MQREDKILASYRRKRMTEALERLMQLYEALDQKGKANEWQHKLDAYQQADKKPTEAKQR